MASTKTDFRLLARLTVLAKYEKKTDPQICNSDMDSPLLFFMPILGDCFTPRDFLYLCRTPARFTQRMR